MVEAEETKIPIRQVIEKQIGNEINWDQTAAFGLFANLEKSGALTIKVAKLANEFMTELTKAQPNSEPEIVEPWWMTGPPPSALTNVQMRNEIPAIGHRTALTVNK